MIDLDKQEKISKLLGGIKVIKSINSFPQQLQQSIKESFEVKFPQAYSKINNITVCAMGGSRFTPFVVKELFKSNISIPFIINDDYILPEYVNNNSLVILSSYSGTTEEVLICGEKAREKNAKIVCISTGGELINFGKKNNYPCYKFIPAYNPSNQPRIGFGYIIGGVIGLLSRLNLLNIPLNQVEAVIEKLPQLLSNNKIKVQVKQNPAKQMAINLFQKYPYYIVSEFLTGVGNAIQNQTNENAKQISTFRVIPELNHHMMEGLKLPTIHRDLAVFVFFFSKFYSEKIKKRYHVTKDVVEQNKINTIWHELRGGTAIEQVFELLGFGSFMTMYLSALNEQDPTVIPYVDYFKKKLKEVD